GERIVVRRVVSEGSCLLAEGVDTSLRGRSGRNKLVDQSAELIQRPLISSGGGQDIARVPPCRGISEQRCGTGKIDSALQCGLRRLRYPTSHAVGERNRSIGWPRWRRRGSIQVYFSRRAAGGHSNGVDADRL